jgi:dienelactone hydrolase
MESVTVHVFRRPAAAVHGTLFLPAGAAAAAVLVIGGSGGSEPSYVAGALAREGMAALSLAYFGRPGLPPQLAGIPLEYFTDALHILRAAVPSPRVPAAVAGMSRGSEAAMLTAIRATEAVQGVVATVPANVIAGSDPPGGPAWLRDGRPLPYVGHQQPDENPDTVIAVEQVRGPVLLIAAGADQVWPSAAMARALSARLRQHGDPHGHTLLEYPRAGHCLGYLIPQLPPGLLPPGLTDQPADQAARASAWPQTIEFLRHLPQPQ